MGGGVDFKMSWGSLGWVVGIDVVVRERGREEREGWVDRDILGWNKWKEVDGTGQRRW